MGLRDATDACVLRGPARDGAWRSARVSNYPLGLPPLSGDADKGTVVKWVGEFAIFRPVAGYYDRSLDSDLTVPNFVSG